MNAEWWGWVFAGGISGAETGVRWCGKHGRNAGSFWTAGLELGRTGKGPGRRSRKEGKKQKGVRIKSLWTRRKKFYLKWQKVCLLNTAGITTRMARTFLRGVQDLVGSCRQKVIARRCCCSAPAAAPATLTSSWMEPGLIEQGEIYSMQCCEFHGKGARKSAKKN